MKSLSGRTSCFTDSVIRRMTRVSNTYNAINLSQGFPDFDPPKELLERLSSVAFLVLTSIPLHGAPLISGLHWQQNSHGSWGYLLTLVLISLLPAEVRKP